MSTTREQQWDNHFLNLAREVSQMSRDPSTKVGAVIVRPDKTIASTGFNDFPRGMSHIDDRRYSDKEEKYSRIIHAEMNALLTSKDQSLKGYTLYTWPLPPCDRCSVCIIQAGVKKVVYPKLLVDKNQKKWHCECIRAKEYFTECGVEIEELKQE